jgi:hypothetical protein
MNHNSMHRAILIAILAMAVPAVSFAGFFNVGIGVNVGFAPPPLPVYAQPPCPAPGYIWTPGYWGYSDDDDDYYWVPGTWVMAPSEGLLWTPGYWGEVGGGYVWNEGYWGPQVGFYGGINYGFGYFGEGFAGGYWRGRDFFYNRSVTNVSNVNITNVYNHTVNSNFVGNRASFNGVNGVPAAPTHSDLLAARQPHYAPTAPQRTQAAAAQTLRTSLASINHGRPPIAATQRPGSFQGSGVVAANGAQGSRALAYGNRGQSSPTASRPFASGQHGWQAQRTYNPQNSFPTQSGRQPPHSYQTYPAPRNYQAPHNYQTYQAPRNYQAPHNYQAYQAPRNYPAPHNYQAYQAPRNYQAPHRYNH